MLKKYASCDAIVFDFDGVIVESVDVKTKAFAALYVEYGDRIVEQVKAYHLLHGGISRFEKFRYYHQVLLGKPLSPEEEIQLGDRFSEYVEDAVVNSSYVTGAYEFLEKYHRSIPMFVASGTPDAELKRIISRRQIQHCFKSVHGSPAKKGEIILGIVKKYGFAPECVWMIGDAISDYEGAIAAGVKFIGRVLDYPNSQPFITDVPIMPDLVSLEKLLNL